MSPLSSSFSSSSLIPRKLLLRSLIRSSMAETATPSSSPILSLLRPPPPQLRLNSSPSSFILLLRRTAAASPLSLSLNSSPVLRLSTFSAATPLQEVAEAVAETETAVEEEEEKAKKKGETLDPARRRMLYVVNLPFTATAIEIKNLFAQCGTVRRVNVAKNKEGKHRGYAFVTMGTRQEADAAIEKLNNLELSGRIIKVEHAKIADESNTPASGDSPAAEKRSKFYQVFVSNLNWKVRPSDLREFFSANFKPRSARVIFDSKMGKSAGYGFVSFDSKEDAEASVSSLDGKELMGRPIVLKFGENNSDSGKKEEKKDSSEELGDELVEKQPEQP